jgi:hypothetical protein
LCTGHHAAHHDGHLIIRGAADALEVIRIDEREPENVHVENADAKANEIAEMRGDATLALTGLGS